MPPTNDGVQARRNLDGEIEMHERRGKLDQLVPRLEERALFWGRIADRERALVEVEAWVAKAPEDWHAFRARAGLRSAFHRFDEALADLARVDALGGKSADERAEIAQALGRIDEALAQRAELARQHPGVLSVGAHAVVLADLGRAEEADARFAEALGLVRNPSPFPVAWIAFQRGLTWEKAGQPARARPFYEDAVARLPGYAAATGHLAGVLAAAGERKSAIDLLRPLLESSDDPEYAGQLAALVRAEGDAAQADALAARARARYEELLARHAEAYALHAARFYLGEGKDAKRAAQLAAGDLARRPSGDGFELATEAYLAAGDTAGACRVAEGGLAARTRTARQLAVYWRAFSACHDDKRAAEVDALLKVSSSAADR